jgi:peptidoglycan/xylan/chitin deacetylase (PgdA/CDA1 family)
MASRLPILMYHAVHPDRSLISTAPLDFEQQMRWLYDQGYQTLPFSGFVDHLRNKTPFPERTVVITFDDGFESLYTYAVPVLTAYGFTATIFLVTDYCGQKNSWPGQPQSIPEFPLLSWEQICEMDHLGFEFGAHSASHPRLDQLTPDRLEYEVAASKKIIEEHLGHAVETFAYPYGQYNQKVIQVVQDAFRGACSTKPGLAGYDSDPFEIERVDINYLNHSWLFPWISGPLASSYLKGRGVLRYLAGKVLNRTWR